MANLRNICFVGQSNVGKTSLAEAILYNTGNNDRLGRVVNDTTLTDNEPDEIKRKITLLSKIIFCKWKNTSINLTITPGYADFIGEVIPCLKIADSCTFVLDACGDIEVQTEKISALAKNYNTPTSIFVNKMEKEGASFVNILEKAKKLFSKPIPLQIPIGEGENFKGIIDILTKQAYIYTDFEQKIQFEKKEIPEELKDEVETYYNELIEAIAEIDDSLLEKYLEGQTLNDKEILNAIKQAFIKQFFTPVFCGSSYLNIGIVQFLDAVEKFFPCFEELTPIEGINENTEEKEIRKPDLNESFSGLVFKTITVPHVGEMAYLKVYSGKINSGDTIYNSTSKQKEKIGNIVKFKGKNKEDINSLELGDIGCLVKLKATKTNHTLCSNDRPIILPKINFPEPVISFSVSAKAKGDEEKISLLLSKIADDDLCFNLIRDTVTKEMVVSGMGDMHLEIIFERLVRKFGIEAELGKPKIAYKETVKGSAKAQGKHKKQSGGRGQFGDVWLEISTLPRGTGFKFEDKIFGGSIPSKYVPSIEKGVREVLEHGVISNYPIVDTQVTVYDGSFHPVDSSDIAFKIAASLSFKKAFREAQPILLEPIMNVNVTVPEEYMGDITSDLNGRRGRILGMDAEGKYQIVKAQVPLADLYKYATDLRSKTQGKGNFSMKFSHYQEVPGLLTEKIIAENKKEKEDEE